LITRAFFGCLLGRGVASAIGGNGGGVRTEKLLAVLGLPKCSGDTGENGSIDRNAAGGG